MAPPMGRLQPPSISPPRQTSPRGCQLHFPLQQSVKPFCSHQSHLYVNSQPYNQVIQGAVVCGSTNVPNAYVALVENSGGNVQIVVLGTTADSNGNYSLRALPGVYQVMAFHSGYVGSLPNFPVVTLQTNATVTTNLNLIAATTTMRAVSWTAPIRW